MHGYQRIQIRTDTRQHMVQMANPTQRTSVALPPFEVAKDLLFSLGAAQMSWECGRGLAEEPTPNPAETSQAEAQQTTTVSVRGRCALYLPATAIHQKDAGWT